jgi:hypothetical protein
MNEENNKTYTEEFNHSCINAELLPNTRFKPNGVTGIILQNTYEANNLSVATKELVIF